MFIQYLKYDLTSAQKFNFNMLYSNSEFVRTYPFYNDQSRFMIEVRSDSTIYHREEMEKKKFESLVSYMIGSLPVVYF